MENPCLTGVQAVGNSRIKQMMQPWAVIDVENGIEIFSGTEQECRDYAENKETGRIDPNLTLCPIF